MTTTGLGIDDEWPMRRTKSSGFAPRLDVCNAAVGMCLLHGLDFEAFGTKTTNRQTDQPTKQPTEPIHTTNQQTTTTKPWKPSQPNQPTASSIPGAFFSAGPAMLPSISGPMAFMHFMAATCHAALGVYSKPRSAGYWYVAFWRFACLKSSSKQGAGRLLQGFQVNPTTLTSKLLSFKWSYSMEAAYSNCQFGTSAIITCFFESSDSKLLLLALEDWDEKKSLVDSFEPYPDDISWFTNN